MISFATPAPDQDPEPRDDPAGLTFDNARFFATPLTGIDAIRSST